MPKPGPTLLKQEMAANRFVSRSNREKDRLTISTAMLRIYRAKYTATLWAVCSSSRRPSILITSTTRGRRVWRSSRRIILNRMATRETFRPPAVLPAQPPTNISPSSSTLLRGVHTVKSAVIKPVVLIIEATWKAAWRRESEKVRYSGMISAVITATDTSTMARYTLNSVLRKTSRIRPRRIR